MRKIIILTLCYIFFCIGICNANVTIKNNDEFTGGTVITSKIFTDYNMSRYLDCIVFTKTATSNIARYTLQTDATTSLGSPKDIEINVDGDYLFEPIHTDIKSSLIDYRIRFVINYDISDDMVEKIRNANRIALKCKIGDFTKIYILPDEVLTEWKQVINTEK